MRRLFASLVVAASILAVMAVPVAAGTRQDVTIEVTTIFDDQPDEFEADGLLGCETGLVYDGGGHFKPFMPGPGIFAGYKVFVCGPDDGFVLRLNARFTDSGSVGTWSVVASWGSVSGIRGAGSLTGEPIGSGIIDTYAGTVTV